MSDQAQDDKELGSGQSGPTGMLGFLSLLGSDKALAYSISFCAILNVVSAFGSDSKLTAFFALVAAWLSWFIYMRAGEVVFVMRPMDADDGRIGHYISHPDFYCDIESDANGEWSIFFRDRATGKEVFAKREIVTPNVK